MEPREFLRALWGEDHPGKILVWTMPGKRSHWLNTPKRPLADIAKIIHPDAPLNVYTAMVSVPADHPEKTNARFKKNHRLAAMACLWADIDIKHEAHKKKKLPEDRPSAIELLNSLDYRPTILINSGHGIQAFWLFETPWLFQSMEEQQTAAQVAQWWHSKIAAACKKRGWTTDSVWDMTRVMRIPGYTNHKPDTPPVPVTAIKTDGPRIPIAQLLAQAQAEGLNGQTNRPDPKKGNEGAPAPPDPFGQETYSFYISAYAQPPAGKLEAMLENLPKFKQTWNMKRRDMPQDESASGYDMSLADQAINAGWSEQETVNLLIAFRRHHGLPAKLRGDYYRRTLDKALKNVKTRESQSRIADIVDEKVNSDQEREAIRHHLSTVWSVRINRLVKTLGDPPEFWMSTGQGEITIGKVDNIIRQSAFRALVAASTSKLIPKVAEAKWQDVAQALLNLAEEEDLGAASHPKEEIREWILRYLDDKRAVTQDEEGAMHQRQPFVKNGETNIFMDDFRIWLKTRNDIAITGYELSRRMHHAGFGKNNPKLRSSRNTEKPAGEHRTSRHTWIVPQQWTGDPEEEQEP